MDSIHEEISQGSTLRRLHEIIYGPILKGWTDRSVDPSNREIAAIGGFGDFHNSDFDFTFEDVMMFELQNIHDDFPMQIQPLMHQDFENMR